jgi:hypothetical protein
MPGGDDIRVGFLVRDGQTVHGAPHDGYGVARGRAAKQEAGRLRHADDGDADTRLGGGNVGFVAARDYRMTGGQSQAVLDARDDLLARALERAAQVVDQDHGHRAGGQDFHQRHLGGAVPREPQWLTNDVKRLVADARVGVAGDHGDKRAGPEQEQVAELGDRRGGPAGILVSPGPRLGQLGQGDRRGIHQESISCETLSENRFASYRARARSTT